MKKAWLLLVLILVIATQWTFLSAFHSVSESQITNETSAVVISKANYAFMRAHIEIFPEYIVNYTAQTLQQANVTLTFQDGSQKQITENYAFDVFLTRTASHFGSISAVTPGYSILISDDHPINAAVMSNVSEDFFTYGVGSSYLLDRIDVYWFKIEGDAHVSISGYGLAI
ncbi:MAG: hypothetical protein NWF05_02435 [Candidatus Bathyarchaeota archaeon]|nr:hypothetical protein [Candidatus Bathyarchaeota archaeon]